MTDPVYVKLQESYQAVRREMVVLDRRRTVLSTTLGNLDRTMKALNPEHVILLGDASAPPPARKALPTSVRGPGSRKNLNNWDEIEPYIRRILREALPNPISADRIVQRLRDDFNIKINGHHPRKGLLLRLSRYPWALDCSGEHFALAEGVADQMEAAGK